MTCTPAAAPKRFSNSLCHTSGCGLRIVGEPAPLPVEGPVAFELVIVVAVATVQDGERRLVGRFAEHPGGQHFVDLEAVAIVQAGAGGEAPHVVRIAPQQQARGAPGPHLPLHTVALRIPEQVGVAGAPVVLIGSVDVRRMERQAQLLHPVLRVDPRFEPLVERVIDHGIRQVLGPKVDAHVRPLGLNKGEDFMPKAGHLRALETAFIVHAELDAVDFGENAPGTSAAPLWCSRRDFPR